MIEQYYNLIKNLQIFNNLNEKDIMNIVQSWNPKFEKFKKGELIRHEGQDLNDFFVILKGEAMAVRIKQNGERSIYEYIPEGSPFGNVFDILPKGRKWSVDIITKTDCIVLFGTRRIFDRDSPDYSTLPHEYLMNVISLLGIRSEQYKIGLRCLKNRTVRQKISTYIYEMHLKNGGGTQMLLEYNRMELADYLNLPQPSLSRELANMKKEGIIDYYKESIKILDLERLKLCTWMD